MLQDWITAIGLLFVIEGALYALFPGMMRRAIQMALSMNEGQLRFTGLASAAIGVAVVWLARM